MRKGVSFFLQNTSIFARRPKKGKRGGSYRNNMEKVLFLI